MLRGISRRFGKKAVDEVGNRFIQASQKRFDAQQNWRSLIEKDFRSGFEDNEKTKDYDWAALNDVLVKPSIDLMERPGKKIRPLLIEIAAELLGQTNQEWIDKTSALIETVHSNFLIIDDIMDSSETRRGKPVVHLIYGVDVALASAGFVYNNALLEFTESLSGVDDAKKFVISNLILKCAVEVYVGLGWDVKWHLKKTLERMPSFDNYYTMCERKTAKLMNLGIDILAVLHNSDPVPLSAVQKSYSAFGVFFQINDDLINLYSNEYSQLKGLDDDLIETKASFPILHFIHNSQASQASKERLIHLLNTTPKDRDCLDAIKALIKTQKCLSDGLEESKQRLDECLMHLSGFAASNSECLRKIRAISSYLVKDDLKMSS